MPGKQISTDWITSYCDSTTAVFIPISPWMKAGDIAKLRFAFELRAIINALQVQAAYQATNDVRTPGSATGFGSAKSTEGFEDPSGYTDVTTAFAGSDYFRLGFLCSNTTGTNMSLGRIAGTIHIVTR